MQDANCQISQRSPPNDVTAKVAEKHEKNHIEPYILNFPFKVSAIFLRKGPLIFQIWQILYLSLGPKTNHDARFKKWLGKCSLCFNVLFSGSEGLFVLMTLPESSS